MNKIAKSGTPKYSSLPIMEIKSLEPMSTVRRNEVVACDLDLQGLGSDDGGQDFSLF